MEQCGHHHFIWTFSNYPSFSSRKIIYQKKLVPRNVNCLATFISTNTSLNLCCVNSGIPEDSGEFLNTRETPASPNMEAAGSKSYVFEACFHFFCYICQNHAFVAGSIVQSFFFVLWKGQLSRRLIIVFLFVFWLLRSCPTCRDPSRWEATWPCRSSLSACLETCQPSSSCQARLCAGLETSSQNNCPTWCWCTGSPSRACSPRRSRSSTKTLPSPMLRSPSCYQNKSRSGNLTMIIDNFVSCCFCCWSRENIK